MFVSRRGTPLSERTIQYGIRAITEKCGFDVDYTLQDIRDSGIVLMLRSCPEGDVADYIGVSQQGLTRYRQQAGMPGRPLPPDMVCLRVVDRQAGAGGTAV